MQCSRGHAITTTRKSAKNKNIIAAITIICKEQHCTKQAKTLERVRRATAEGPERPVSCDPRAGSGRSVPRRHQIGAQGIAADPVKFWSMIASKYREDAAKISRQANVQPGVASKQALTEKAKKAEEKAKKAEGEAQKAQEEAKEAQEEAEQRAKKAQWEAEQAAKKVEEEAKEAAREAMIFKLVISVISALILGSCLGYLGFPSKRRVSLLRKCGVLSQQEAQLAMIFSTTSEAATRAPCVKGVLCEAARASTFPTILVTKSRTRNGCMNECCCTR